MKIVLIAAFAVLISTVFGCGVSSSTPKAPTPSSTAPAGDPQGGSTIVNSPTQPRGHGTDGKWVTACTPTSDGSKSLQWSLEFSNRQITSAEYVFADPACQSLISTKADLGTVDIEAASDGSDAKFMQLGSDRVVVASYYESTDKIYFHVRGYNEFSSFRLTENSNGAREFSRSGRLPDFVFQPSRITNSNDFGTSENQKLTYISRVFWEDKRNSQLSPYTTNVSRELIWLATTRRNGQLDVRQRAAASNNSDFYWSNTGSDPEPFVERARAHDEHAKCAGGQIQSVSSPLGVLRACVVDRLPKMKTTYSTGPAFVGLSTEFEFQNDKNFRIVHGYELIGANW